MDSTGTVISTDPGEGAPDFGRLDAAAKMMRGFSAVGPDNPNFQVAQTAFQQSKKIFLAEAAKHRDFYDAQAKNQVAEPPKDLGAIASARIGAAQGLGGAGGALLGGAAGTAVMPGPGTLVGALLGGMGGSAVVKPAAEALSSAPASDVKSQWDATTGAHPDAQFAGQVGGGLVGGGLASVARRWFSIMAPAVAAGVDPATKAEQAAQLALKTRGMTQQVEQAGLKTQALTQDFDAERTIKSEQAAQAQIRTQLMERKLQRIEEKLTQSAASGKVPSEDAVRQLLEKQNMPDEVVEQAVAKARDMGLAKPAGLPPNPESSAAGNAASTTQTANRLADYATRLSGLTDAQVLSHLQWTQNRLTQGPWMQQNLKVITAELTKRGLLKP